VTFAMALTACDVRAAEPVAPAKQPEAAAPAAGPVPLAAHKAVYDLTLLKSIGAKGPTSARGRIAFDFSGSACEGYSQTFRQLTELQPAEGPTRVSDMHSATFEDAEDTTFAFSMHTVVDSGDADVVDGRAVRAADGAVSTSLTKPVRGKFDIDPDVVFPTAHLQRILTAAEAGQNILQVKVYDGSETGRKIYETTTVIGHPVEAPVVEKAAHIPELDAMRRWPVSISYFEIGKKDEPPSYTLSFDLYENGISRALRLDYGDFILAGEMTSLELLPAKTCAK
jgi:hypothetical protein